METKSVEPTITDLAQDYLDAAGNGNGTINEVLIGKALGAVGRTTSTAELEQIYAAISIALLASEFGLPINQLRMNNEPPMAIAARNRDLLERYARNPEAANTLYHAGSLFYQFTNLK